MKGRELTGVVALAIAAACGSGKSPSSQARLVRDTSVARASAGLSLRPDLRRACARVASTLLVAGAPTVGEKDTVLDSNQYHPRQLGCLIWADSFIAAPSADLFKSGRSSAGWSWHPFEGGSDEVFGIRQDSLQCEATPLGAGARRGDIAIDPRKSRFHVFCYPD